jgi:hypothetical protein
VSLGWNQPPLDRNLVVYNRFTSRKVGCGAHMDRSPMMAKRSHAATGNTREFADLASNGAQQMMGATSFGVNWFREIADQGLSQSKAVLDGYLAISKKALENADRQAIDMNRRSMLVVEETLSNAFDFAHKLVSAREPQQLATLQSEFVSRQAEIFADQMKVLGKTALQRGNEMADATVREAERMRRR